MGVAKPSAQENTTFVDLGFGDVSLVFNSVANEYCELHMEDLETCGRVGRTVLDKPNHGGHKVTLTFPLESPDSLDVLLIRLLEMRQKYYGNVPSTVFRE